MANFSPLTGYPRGPNAPWPHDAANETSEDLVKTVNASDGSSHAPTGDIAWSGANGHGFAFSVPNPLPFHGYLDPSAGLYFKVGGFVRFDAAVALDVFGPVTFYTGASPVVQTGTHFAFSTGSHLDVSGEANLNGATNIRGAVLFRSTANGGPATVGVEADVVWQWQNGSEEDFLAGSHLKFKGASFLSSEAATVATWLGRFDFVAALVTGDTGSTFTWSGPVARSTSSGYTALRTANGPTSDATVNLWQQDTLRVVDLASDTTYTLAHPPGGIVVDAVIHWHSQATETKLTLTDAGGAYVDFHTSSTLAEDGTVATWHLRYEPTAARWVVIDVKRGARVFTGTDAPNAPPWNYDVILVPLLATVDRTYTITTPPTGVSRTVVVKWAVANAGKSLIVNGYAIAGVASALGSSAIMHFEPGYGWVMVGRAAN